MKERDTAILSVRIKKDLLSEVQVRTTKLKISRNSWVIKAIEERLREHTKRDKGMAFDIMMKRIREEKEKLRDKSKTSV